MQIGTQEFGDKVDILKGRNEDITERDNILMLQVLQKLQFPVCPLGQDRGAEGLHNLLDSNILARQLIFGGANKTKSAHANRLEIRVSRRDLKGSAEDLGSNEFRHCEMIAVEKRATGRTVGGRFLGFEGVAKDVGMFIWWSWMGVDGGWWMESPSRL